jgi:hypothetical protein
MDKGAIVGELTAEEIRGRNTGTWTAGNQHFWDGVARNRFVMDLLKTLDNRNTRAANASRLSTHQSARFPGAIET